ncbi:Na+/H+ antiporter NhaA, partial [Bacteroidota bacterium]
LAILKLLGNKVPLSLKIFLTAFAIIDDIGAVMVIAIFYTGDISWLLLLYAGILFIVLYLLSYLRIHNKVVLLIFGIVIWLLFLKAGVHPTIAGILLAFAVPIRQRITEFRYAQKLEKIAKRLTASNNTNKLPVLSKKQIEEIDNLEEWTNKVQSPLQQLEHRLHYWVAFLIMPIFALSNAGVHFSSEMIIDFSLALNIAVSLFIGKAVGVSLFSYISIKLKVAEQPKHTNFIDIIGVAILSGVGFTMSLFIGGLAFNDNDIFMNSAKIGIIVGSVVSGVVGYIILRWSIIRKTVSNNKYRSFGK